MKEYIVMYDYGYGVEYEVVEAENEDDADKKAHDLWLEAVEQQANYGVIGLATDDLKNEYL